VGTLSLFFDRIDVQRICSDVLEAIFFAIKIRDDEKIIWVMTCDVCSDVMGHTSVGFMMHGILSLLQHQYNVGYHTELWGKP
jgi:hypothetical protein